MLWTTTALSILVVGADLALVAPDEEHTPALDTREYLRILQYGRLQEVCLDGDRATGRIRVKSRFGAFVEPESLEKNATDASHPSDTLQSTTEFRNVVLEDSSRLYCS